MLFPPDVNALFLRFMATWFINTAKLSNFGSIFIGFVVHWSGDTKVRG